MSKHHELKIQPVYFEKVYDRTKTFEVRKNDRDFKSGDTVSLNEWSPDMGFSGRTLRFDIGYVLPLDRFYGSQNDMVVFSILEPK